jgi:PAS domain S-box-containing protein
MGGTSPPESGRIASLPGGVRDQDRSVVAFAAIQLLGDSPLQESLPAVLERLAEYTGAQAALALQFPVPDDFAVLGACPRGAARDMPLLAAVSDLSWQHRDTGAALGSVEAQQAEPARGNSRKASILLAYPRYTPGNGQPTCVLALTGGGMPWTAKAHTAARAVVSILGTCVQQASDEAELAQHRALTDARFRQLAELAPVGIAQTDRAGQIVYVNDRWCALTGMRPQAAAGGPWTRTVHPGDVSRVEREGKQAFKRGTELRTDCRLRPTAAGDTWVHAVVSPLTGSDGQLAGWLAALTNISDRKRQEQEGAMLLDAEQQSNRRLADQTERLRSLIAAAIPGVLFTDEHGRITELNTSFCDLFGLGAHSTGLVGTPAEGLVRQIKDVFAEPDEFVRRTSQAMRRRQPVTGEQMTCADGRTLEGDYWPVLVDGQYRGDLWLAWDMSDRTARAKQRERRIDAERAARQRAEAAQQMLAQHNTRLQETADEKANYLAAASHELGTPLAAIVAVAGLIRQHTRDVSADIDQALNVIERNAGELAHMIEELSVLSRVEAGILPLQLSPVSIPDLLEQEVRSASAGAAQDGITIHVASGHGPAIHCDPHRMRQVLANIISNAVKFSRPDGQVRVTAAFDHRWWLIEVHDAGMGIPASELSKIFGRFSRASNAQAAHVPGTGLGLSIVKAITELHGGSVDAHSTVGGPTTFRIRLPLHPDIPDPVTGKLPAEGAALQRHPGRHADNRPAWTVSPRPAGGQVTRLPDARRGLALQRPRQVSDAAEDMSGPGRPEPGNRMGPGQDAGGDSRTRPAAALDPGGGPVHDGHLADIADPDPQHGGQRKIGSGAAARDIIRAERYRDQVAQAAGGEHRGELRPRQARHDADPAAAVRQAG